MNSNNKNTSYGFKFAAFAVILTVIAAASIYSTSAAKENSRSRTNISFVNPVAPVPLISPFVSGKFDETSAADTTSIKKGKRTLKFYDKENGEKKKFKAKLNNGKLEELSIDGEAVDQKDLPKYEERINQRLNEYDEGMKEYQKGMEKYKESMEAYKESMEKYHAKMKDFRVHSHADIDVPDIDLSELKDLAREIRENVSAHIPRVPGVHVPPVHIPPIHIPPIDLSELKESMKEFDSQQFREEMKEWKENFKKNFQEGMKDWNVDMRDFKVDMEKFNREMKEHGPGSEAFKKSMEELKVNMGNLKVEMKKLKEFINDVKEELVKDKLMDEGDDLDDFTLSKDEMIVGGKKVSPELHKKYLELYKKHYGKELTGDKKFRIND